MTADFTITIRDTEAGCWVTLTGNRTGTTLQRCVPSGSMMFVLFCIARMWKQGAEKVRSRTLSAPLPPSRG